MRQRTCSLDKVYIWQFGYFVSFVGISFSLSLLMFSNFNFSDEHGDRPRSLPVIKELAKATDITERKESPSWDYDVSGFNLHS